MKTPYRAGQPIWTRISLLLPVPTGGGVTLPSYAAGVQGDATVAHDGGLRWAVGAQDVQVVRSAADNPSQTDGTTTNYRHHPFIAYWHGLSWIMHDGSGARISRSASGGPGGDE